MTDPKTREAVLQRLLTGDLAETAPEAKALFQADPTARARLAELRAVASLLDEAASEEAETFSEARTLRDAPGAERVEATLERLRDETRRPRPERAPARVPGRRWWPVVLAAAASLVVWLAVRSGEDAPIGPPDDFVLGTDAIEPLAPIGEVAAYGTFSWRADVPGGTFVLEIRDATSDEMELVHTTERLTGATWTPDQEVRDALPTNIRWTVRAYGPAGEPLEPGIAYASLSDS